jgi:hypothetical protein
MKTLYGCETWSLTLREVHGQRVFDNRVMREIFGPRRDEVIGGWRKLQNEDRIMKSRRIRWDGHVAIGARIEKCMEHFVGRKIRRGRNPLEVNRCANNIKINSKETVRGGVDCVPVA